MSTKTRLREFTKKISNVSVDLAPRFARKTWPWLPDAVVTRLSGFQCLAHPGETVVLAGVFRADTVAAWADRVGPTGRVIAIEANPTSAARLSNSFRANANVRIVDAALIDEPKPVSLAVFEGEYHGFDCVIAEDSNLIGSPLYEDFSMNRRSRTIQVSGTSLDRLLPELQVSRLDVLIMTINGVELSALRGAEAVLQKAENLRLQITTQFDYEEADRVSNFLKVRDFKSRIFRRPSDGLVNVIAVK